MVADVIYRVCHDTKIVCTPGQVLKYKLDKEPERNI